jgi:hypothetical protein
MAANITAVADISIENENKKKISIINLSKIYPSAPLGQR